MLIYLKNKITEEEFPIIKQIYNIDYKSKVIYLDIIDDNIFNENTKIFEKSTNKYIIFLSGLIYFFNLKNINEYKYKFNKIGKNYNKNLNNLIESSFKILKETEDDSIKTNILIIIFNLLKDTNKHISQLIKIIISLKIDNNILFLLKEYIIKTDKNIKNYLYDLKSVNIDHLNETDLKLLISIFQKFDIKEFNFINNKINEIKNNVHKKLNEIEMIKYSFNCIVPNIKLTSNDIVNLIIDFDYDKLHQNGTSILHYTSTYSKDINSNFGETKLDIIQLTSFKIMNNFFIHNFKLIDKSDIMQLINNSTIITESDKTFINISINEYINNTNIVLCIDSLACKFDSIIRNVLKDKKINTMYLDNKDNSIVENSLGRLLEDLSNIIKNKNIIKYLQLVLNNKHCYGIRNNIAHSFYNNNQYIMEIMENLILCILLITKIDFE